jgi:uncharacterized LabA/DUF88 family protein
MASEKVLLFIDAGFLSKLSKYFGEGEYINFKIKDFVNNLSKKYSFEFKNVFYYTAPPFQSNNPSKSEMGRKERYDKFKSFLIKDGFLVREGRVQRLKINNSFEYKQKGVDTLLAIDLSHIKEDNPDIKKIILVSSDTDFVPVIEDIKRRGIEVILFTYFDRKRGSLFSLSNHLLMCCSKYIKLKKEDMKDEN